MKRVLALLLVAIAAPTFAQTPPPKLEVTSTQFTLPNGLTVILHEDHRVPMVTTNMWYHVGSAREKPGRTGFAHLFEHLMFMGSGHVKPGEFDEWLEESGGDNNGRPRPIAPTTGSTSPRTPSSWRCFSSQTAWGTCSSR